MPDDWRVVNYRCTGAMGGVRGVKLSAKSEREEVMKTSRMDWGTKSWKIQMWQ
jgi:hypothetical protein